MKFPCQIAIGLAAILAACGNCLADSPFSPAEILRNMPVNSESRCVGISLVAAALLEGQVVEGDDCDLPAELGQQIYDGTFKRVAPKHHLRLCLDAGPQPIQSRVSLEKLSTIVADLYKQRHLELIASEQGIQRLRTAMSKIVMSSNELDAILDADADHIDVFLCAGIRRFPDGTFKDTNHAILITKDPAGDRVVYDPNEPGSAIACRLNDTEDGLEITWKCQYRDTGQVTIQRYHLLAKESFFRFALAKE